MKLLNNLKRNRYFRIQTKYIQKCKRHMECINKMGKLLEDCTDEDCPMMIIKKELKNLKTYKGLNE